MWLRIGTTHTHAERTTDTERAWLDFYLGLPNPKARFTGGSAKTPLYNVVSDTFPSGLVPLVLAGAKEAGHSVQVLDTRTAPCTPDPKARIDWLRDYQEIAVEKGAVHHRGVFHCPTASGKTEVLVALSHIYPCSWAVFVHRTSLLAQTAERFRARTGEEVGLLGAGQRSFARVTVAMWQTVYSGLASGDATIVRWLEGVQGFHADEVHAVAAKTFWQIAMRAKQAHFRFGYSGTPFARGDQRGLLVVAATGPVIYRISADTLVQAGAIAKPRVLRVLHRTVPHANAGTYAEAYREAVAEDEVRLVLLEHVVRSAPKPCLIFVRAIEHGRRACKALLAHGVKAEFVWGAKNLPQREAAIRRLIHADTDVLVTNVIFQEGVDIPELKSIVHAGGGASHIAALQNAGRGMRRRDGAGNLVKDVVPIYDIADVHCGCKSTDPVSKKSRYAHRVCRWMERHTRSRLRAYLGEGYEVVEWSP